MKNTITNISLPSDKMISRDERGANMVLSILSMLSGFNHSYYVNAFKWMGATLPAYANDMICFDPESKFFKFISTSKIKHKAYKLYESPSNEPCYIREHKMLVLNVQPFTTILSSTDFMRDLRFKDDPASAFYSYIQRLVDEERQAWRKLLDVKTIPVAKLF